MSLFICTIHISYIYSYVDTITIILHILQSVFIANAKKCGLLSTDKYKFTCNVPCINTVLSNRERSKG